MLDDLTTGIVRVLDATGATVGTGFVVTDGGLIATCTHVMETASAGPGDRVTVMFHANGELGQARVISNGWHPKADVAFVRLSEPLPEGVVPFALTPSAGREAQPVRVFGYPEVGKVDGLWGDGRLIGRVTEEEHTLLQLSSTQITRGFSGGPVWDTATGCVIGMVVQIAPQDRYGKLEDVAFAIPIEALHNLAPEAIPLQSAPLDSAAPFIVPFIRNPDFVGREEDLERLHQALAAEGPTGIRPTGLTGMGGIGKTQLAVEYAYSHRDDYPEGIFWLNAANLLLHEFAKLAETMGLANRETTRDQAARQAWVYLDTRPASLVIFDHVREPAHLNIPFAPGLIPANLRCRTLFTTRRRDLPRNFQPLEVKVLPEDAATRLLLRARSEVLDEHHPEWDTARMICTSLGRLPLALELAAAYLGEYPEVTLPGYLQRLRTEGKSTTVDDTELRPEDLLTRHEAAVTATLRTQWRRLDKGVHKDARLLFQAAGQFLEGAWIPIARLGLLTGIEAEAGPGRVAPLTRALKKLYAVSLIEELTGRRLRLHPLVQEFAAWQMPEENAPAFRQRCVANLVDAYESVTALENHCTHRGIDAVLRDLITAIRWLPRSRQISGRFRGVEDRLQIILRILQREAHNLRGWDREQQPTFFAQQVRNQAMDMDLSSLVADATSRLVQLGRPYLLLSWHAGSRWSASERTLSGHEGTVHTAVVTSDGRQVLSASGDHTIRVWDFLTGQTVQILGDHEGWVNDVTVTSDGRHAISASADHVLKIWDLQTGEAVHTLTGHEGPVNAVAVTPDGRYALSASADHTVRVWDIRTGQAMQILGNHEGWVNDVAVTSDGCHAISASADHVLKIWDLQTGEAVHTLTGHEGPVNAVAVTPDGRYTLSASADHTVRVWDIRTGRTVYDLADHAAPVNSIAVTSDGRQAISVSANGTLKVWDVQAGQAVQTIATSGIGADSITLTPDDRHAILVSWDHTLKIRDLETSEPAHMSPGHNRSVNAVAFTPDGHYAASASADHTLKIWDLRGGKTVHTLTGHQGPVNAVAVTPDGCHAVSACADHVLKIWDLQTGEALHTLTGHQGPVNAVAITPDGCQAVSACADCVLKIWDLQTGETAHTLTGHQGPVNAVAVTSDNRHAVSASADHTIGVWDLQTGKLVHSLIGHKGPVDVVELGPDDCHIISASVDHSIKAWRLQTGHVVWDLAGHAGPVTAIDVTPDGRHFISASADCTLRVRNRCTGQSELTLVGHQAPVVGVVVTPDSQRAISASRDRTLRVWDLQTGQLLTMIALESPLLCTALAPDAVTVLTGDVLGNLYCVRYRENNERADR